MSQRLPKLNMTRSAVLQSCLAVSTTVLAGLGIVKVWQSPDSATLAALLVLIAAFGAVSTVLTFAMHSPQKPSQVAEVAQLRSLLAQLPEGVAVLNAAGQIVFANPAACRLLDQPLAKLIGRHEVENGWQYVASSPEDSHRSVFPNIDAQALHPQSVRYRRADQTEIELTYRLVRLEEMRGTVAQSLGYAWIFFGAESVTTTLERNLNTKALGLALQAKSTFMMSIAHELRNPLAAIAGAVSLVERQLGPKADSRLNSHLHILRSATKHLGNVIDTAFEASRQHVGQPALRIESIMLMPLVRDAIGMVAEIAAEKGIRLHCDPLDLALRVCADPTRLTQVLINLLTNALKYNRPAGSVFVRVALIADAIALSVEDTGYGIQPENLTRIFHLFERAEAAESGIGGAGIGLALVKYYVERMNGRIDVTSIVGVGSRFTVTLPRADPASESANDTLPDAAASA